MKVFLSSPVNKINLTKLYSTVAYGCESWSIKNSGHQRINAFNLWCWRGLLRVPWTAKEIKPVNPKGNQPWILIGSSEAEVPILWPPDAKSQLIGKDSVAGTDRSQKQKGATEDEMVGEHHKLNQQESEWTLGDSEGQGGLVCCSPWGLQRVQHNLATEQRHSTISILPTDSVVNDFKKWPNCRELPHQRWYSYHR